MRHFLCWLFAVSCLTLDVVAIHAQPVALPNANFETGAPADAKAPDGWTPDGSGETVWNNNGREGSRAVGVLNGKQDESVFWKTSAENLQPNALYRLSFWSKGAGNIISGLSVANHDFPATPQWSLNSFVFVTPSNLAGAYLRLGQWNGGGELWFDDVQLTQLQPLFARAGILPKPVRQRWAMAKPLQTEFTVLTRRCKFPTSRGHYNFRVRVSIPIVGFWAAIRKLFIANALATTHKMRRA